MTRMVRDLAFAFSAIVTGLVIGRVLLGAALGVQVRRYQPGLWTVRIERLIAFGLDYNGPPFTKSGINLWLTCGEEDQGWRLWPLHR